MIMNPAVRSKPQRITASVTFAACLLVGAALYPVGSQADALGDALGGAIIGGIFGGESGAVFGAGVGLIGGAIDAERREYYRARDLDRYYRDRYYDDRRYYRPHHRRHYRGRRVIIYDD